MKFAYASGSKTLAGYTIKRGIGRGGFGEVYYATSDAGKEVALKLIQRSLDVELRGVTHCLNLKNPHLIEIYDIRESDAGETWIVMEYVAGSNLEAVIERHPQGLPEAEALAWIRGIGAGVAYLHDRGIVHRDLKPGNLFREDGLVKIGDYGLSKFITASRRSAQTESIGTVHYMAPEVARGRYGKEIDVYALGVMLYEMLTGHVPFDGESVGEILMKHLTAEPDLSKIAGHLRAAVGRCLDKDPARRFATAEDLLAALPGGSVITAQAIDLGGNAATPSLNGAAHPAAGPVIATPVADVEVPVVAWPPPEPIARWVSQTWNQLATNPTGLAIFLVVTLLLYTASPLAPVLYGLTFWGGLSYLLYRFIRSVILGFQEPASPPPKATRPTFPPQPRGTPPAATPIVMTPQIVPRHEPVPTPSRVVLRETIPPRTGRQKAAELVGSLLLGAVSSGALGVLLWAMLPWVGSLFDSSFAMPLKFQPEQFAMLVLVGIAGTWAVLIPSKLWEGKSGNPMVRRLVMLLAGFAVGASAFGIDQGLLVDLPYQMQTTPGFMYWPDGTLMQDVQPLNDGGYRIERYTPAGVLDSREDRAAVPSFVPVGHGPAFASSWHLYQADGAPTLLGYLAYFGFLFLVLRWWRQADPLRGSPFSFWSVMTCAAWGLVLAWAWPFPQPWGILWSIIISMSVQLASPWLAKEDRCQTQVN